MGLNPCCNGMKIELFEKAALNAPDGLNPCCNGMKIEWGSNSANLRQFQVLILVVME